MTPDASIYEKDALPWLITDWVTVFKDKPYVDFYGLGFSGNPIIILGIRHTERPDGGFIRTRAEVQKPGGRVVPFPELESECEDFVWRSPDRHTRLVVKVVGVAEFSRVRTYWEGKHDGVASWFELPGTRITSEVRASGLTTLRQGEASHDRGF